jgi:hypothetical protein
MVSNGMIVVPLERDIPGLRYRAGDFITIDPQTRQVTFAAHVATIDIPLVLDSVAPSQRAGIRAALGPVLTLACQFREMRTNATATAPAASARLEVLR